MEMNGPANIKMILNSMQSDINDCGHVTHGNIKKYIEDLNNESDMIINYLKEIDGVLKKHGIEKEVPFWHEIREKNVKR